MIYLAAYQTKDESRRRRIRKILRAYGFEIQPGLYECPITPKLAREMTARLEYVTTQEDRLRVYQVCEDCLQQSRQQGGEDFHRIDRVWVF